MTCKKMKFCFSSKLSFLLLANNAAAAVVEMVVTNETLEQFLLLLAICSDAIFVICFNVDIVTAEVVNVLSDKIVFF